MCIYNRKAEWWLYYITDIFIRKDASIGFLSQYPNGKLNEYIVKEILTEKMNNVYELSVPLKVDINYGADWYEAK